MRAGQARLAGREEEEATCCHGSGPTYQHLHHSLTRLRCLVAWREPVACSVGWAATTAAGNWSHLTWPLHPPTHLPPRCRKWPERGLGQQPGHPEPSTVKAVGRGPLDLSRLAAQPVLQLLPTYLFKGHRLCSDLENPGAVFALSAFFPALFPTCSRGCPEWPQAKAED